MAGFLNKLRSASAGTSSPAAKDSSHKKKDEGAPELTPLEKMLQHAGPVREDGRDKFFGLENFGNTCYCNSMVQALFYSESFRENVVNYPPLTPPDTPNGMRPKVSVTIRPPMNGNATASPAKQKGLSSSEALKRRQGAAAGQPVQGQPGNRPEDKPDSPEYKKKQAMMKGPVLDLSQQNTKAYGMEETTFTGLKDIFLALIESQKRTGVLSPQRFLEIFKRDNEMFRNSMHQDAHEFYGLVLNDVISNVEAHAKRLDQQQDGKNGHGETGSGAKPTGTGWVHDIFEGVLTSETKCLTCEIASQRDETFLDLSIDLDEHASVTSCLRKFSAEEMLCERNKFHCDHCGGLQEAEKRMKIKRLPKVLALHLKRFKYTEDYSRLQKLFHRVVYPYHLRMFNTTDDADDPDRLYELYAVVVHIGGNAYHGHYVSVIKTKEHGWLLFDDEMVEPVDKHFVRNFFGDKPGMACAYVLFYQETTFEEVLAEQEADGLEEVKIASQAADIAHENGRADAGIAPSSLVRQSTQPISPVEEPESLPHLGLSQVQTAPVTGSPPVKPVSEKSNAPILPPTPATPATPATSASEVKTKDDKKRDKKEQEAAEKARKQAAKLEEKRRKDIEIRLLAEKKKEQEELRKAMELSKQLAEEETKKKEGSVSSSAGLLSRSNKGSKSMTRKSFGFLGKDKGEVQAGEGSQNGAGASGHPPEKHEKLKERFSFGLGKKKGGNALT